MKIGNEVNVKNVKGFFKSLKSELASGKEIILDFTDTQRIDSAAAHVIIAAMKKADETGKSIVFKGVSPAMSELLKLAGL